jgi:Na+-driven multidrug efflux pump
MKLIFLLLTAIVVGLVAGAMTYFATYNEYQHHLKGKRVFRESIKSGFVSFVFFFIVTIVVSIILYQLFK